MIGVHQNFIPSKAVLVLNTCTTCWNQIKYERTWLYNEKPWSMYLNFKINYIKEQVLDPIILIVATHHISDTLKNILLISIRMINIWYILSQFVTLKNVKFEKRLSQIPNLSDKLSLNQNFYVNHMTLMLMLWLMYCLYYIENKSEFLHNLNYNDSSRVS